MPRPRRSLPDESRARRTGSASATTTQLAEHEAAPAPGLTIVCTGEVALDRPSQLHPRFLAEARGRTTYLHAMHSGVDWCALAVWSSEGDSWGKPYPLSFHPLELAEDALRHLFGFVYEGAPEPDDPDPEQVTLAAYRVSRP